MEKKDVKVIKSGLRIRKAKGNNKDTSSTCITCENLNSRFGKAEDILYLSSSEATHAMQAPAKSFNSHVWNKIDFYEVKGGKEEKEIIHASVWICADCIRRGEFPLRAVKGLKSLYHVGNEYQDTLQSLLKLF